tara:strand:+ start:119 stop:1417 length:1299 start_codon:yes stop_codon:yes gene_type:complete
MKRNSTLAVVCCLLLLLVSCGKKTSEKTSAPRSQLDAGIIASCTSRAQAEELSQQLGISFRVINEKRKLIEYIGISEEELRKHLPKSNFKINKVYQEVLVDGDFQVQSAIDYPYYGAHVGAQRSQRNASFNFPYLIQVDAFSSSNEGQGAVIAIIDTGVYYNHPHLSPNIFTQNGQMVGWDFYNGDAFPLDDQGHGTHVAGLAAGTLNGVAPKAKIMPVKVMGSDGRGDFGTIVAGILYAVDNGADIINLSLGGSGGGSITADVAAMIDSVIKAKENDVLVVAAAGNGGYDGLGDCNDNSPVYPANINQDNLIAVAAVNQWNELTSYSNFGGATVDIAAPGGDEWNGGLRSAAVPNCFGPCHEYEADYTYQMGTSMATPLVAGLAALVKTKYPQMNYKQIRDKILNGGKKFAELSGLIGSESVINVGLTLSN